MYNVLEDKNNTWDGELADLLRMIWWIDDGDNVFTLNQRRLINESFSDKGSAVINSCRDIIWCDIHFGYH